MINKWWFKLYTKHYLLDLLKVIVLAIILDLAMTNFAGDFSFFAVFLVGAPFIVLFIKNAGGSLRGNIEFHKMSVPFPELKAALFKDILISAGATFGSALTIFFCSMFLGGIFSTKFGLSTLDLIAPGMFLYFCILVFFNGCYILIINKDRKYLMIDRSASRVTNFINTAGLFILGPLILVLIAAIIPTSSLIGLIAPSSIFMGALLFHQKAIFNQYRAKGRLRDFFKFWSAGAAVCCCLYFLCLQISRSDVLNENLNPAQRASSYDFNSRYNPEIDIETFKAIERHVSYDVKSDLYQNLTFDPSSLGPDFYLDDKDPHSTRLVELLRYGRPGPEFLTALYDHFEKKPDYWKERKDFTAIQYLAFAKWPKQRRLPERFIVAKQSSHELFKKEKDERVAKLKARREMASKQEQ